MAFTLTTTHAHGRLSALQCSREPRTKRTGSTGRAQICSNETRRLTPRVDCLKHRRCVSATLWNTQPSKAHPAGRRNTSLNIWLLSPTAQSEYENPHSESSFAHAHARNCPGESFPRQVGIRRRFVGRKRRRHHCFASGIAGSHRRGPFGRAIQPNHQRRKTEESEERRFREPSVMICLPRILMRGEFRRPERPRSTGSRWTLPSSKKWYLWWDPCWTLWRRGEESPVPNWLSGSSGIISDGECLWKLCAQARHGWDCMWINWTCSSHRWSN